MRAPPPNALDVKLSGTGRSLKVVLASAEGHMEMVLGAGQLTKSASRYFPLGGVLFALLDTINPADRVKHQSGLECAVFKLNIANGIATSTKGLTLRTDNINAFGGGALNLLTGEVDIQFKTVQRKGLGVNIPVIANRYIRITGTLSQPRIGLNLSNYIMHGAAVWATEGISLIYEQLRKRLTASSNPCETVL